MIVPSSVHWTEPAAPARRPADSQAKAPDGAWLREMEQQQARQWLLSSEQRPGGTAARPALPLPQAAHVAATDPAAAVHESESPQAGSQARGVPRRHGVPDEPVAAVVRKAASASDPVTSAAGPNEVPQPDAGASTVAAPDQASPGASAPYRPPAPDTYDSATSQVTRTALSAAFARGRALSQADDLATRLESELRDIAETSGAGTGAFDASRAAGPRVHVTFDHGEASLWLGLDAPSGDALAQAALIIPQLRRHIESLGHRLGRVTCNGTVVFDSAGRPSHPTHAFEGMLSIFRNPAVLERP